MNFHLRALAISLIPLLVNCSSHPEIKPYEAPSIDDNPPATAAEEFAFSDAQIESGSDGAVDSEMKSTQEAPVASAPSSTDEEPTAPKPAPKAAPKQRNQASQRENGYYKFSASCMMKAEPRSASADAGAIAAGKKLWLDRHDGQWFKVYKKSGTVYVPAGCIK